MSARHRAPGRLRIDAQRRAQPDAIGVHAGGARRGGAAGRVARPGGRSTRSFAGESRVVYPDLLEGARPRTKRSTTALARGRRSTARRSWALRDIFVANTSISNTDYGGRITFDRAGFLYFTVGERQEPDGAQKPARSHAGKVLRLLARTARAARQPVCRHAGYLPEIYSPGHRSPQGLAVHPQTGEVWENEHGPLGGDEVNIIRAGRNYGWPLVTFGTDYDGTKISTPRRARISRRRSSTGCRRSPSRASPSIPATGSRRGKAARLSGRCSPAERAAPDIGPADHVHGGPADPARAHADRAAPADPRGASGSRRSALPADRRTERRAAEAGAGPARGVASRLDGTRSLLRARCGGEPGVLGRARGEAPGARPRRRRAGS